MAANENTYILDSKTSVGTKQYDDASPSTPKGEDFGSYNSPSNDKAFILEEGSPKKIASSVYQTGFNYVNSIIGSGIVGTPYAFQQAGFGLGIIILFVVALSTDYSLCILVQGGHIAGVSTYQDLVRAGFGKPGFFFLTTIQFIYPFIAMISYNIVIGDTITKVFYRIFNVAKDTVLGNRNFVVFIATLVVTLPLSLYRDIARLSKMSFMSLVFVIFIGVFIVIRTFTMSGKVPLSADAYTFANYGITESIGIMAFACMCHHNSFLLYESLENATPGRWDRITHVSLVISFLLMMVYGVAGYVTFTGFSQGDILENYCGGDDFANAARLLFTITIMLTYPIECFVAREVVENVLYTDKQKSSLLFHSLTTVVIIASAFGISTLTDCLGIVLQLNGVLTAVPLAYILPAATYLKVKEGSVFSLAKFPALLLAVCGMIVAISGTVKAVLDILDGISCSHGVEMPYCLQSFSHTPNSTFTLMQNGSFVQV